MNCKPQILLKDFLQNPETTEQTKTKTLKPIRVVKLDEAGKDIDNPETGRVCP